ncbi:hypothetical protein [Methylorubrum populi]|uniref:hypothetical protein n=1 Tax=Methylorubrum populi TaxID=223967 RepID=UPI0016492E38|nr:hypothetical protein [Methylorubrum populi]
MAAVSPTVGELFKAKAIARHRYSSEFIANPESSSSLKREAVRTAILLAQAQRV